MSNDFLLLQRMIDLEKKVEFLLAELQLKDKYESLPPPVDADVVTLAHQGKLIDAIKLYREKHNAGLLEAKMAVEAMVAPARK